MNIIVSHYDPDFDAVASMVAVEKLYPDSMKIISGVPEENVKKFLDKFSNIFNFTSEKSIKLNEITGLIVVDTQIPDRIGRFGKLMYKKNIKLYIYDHHPKKRENITPELFISEEIGATSTILTHLLNEQGINLRPEEATLLMLGIYEETGGLRYVNTKSKDFQAASILLGFGADLSVVSNYMTQKMDIDHTRMLSQLLDSLELVNIHGFKVYFATASFNNYIKDVSFLIHKIRELENIGIIFSLIEMQGKIHLIARSNNKFVDVGEIAANFSGGGHPTAASSVLHGITLSQAKEKIIEFLHNNLKKEYIAADIMTSHIKTIIPDARIKDAKEYMVKANFNTLPVIEDGKLIGIITRMDLDKALFHHFGDYPVKYYMSTDLITVSPSSSLSEIQKIFARDNIGRLPVTIDDKLVGLITRTDLLRAIHDNYIETLNHQIQESQYPTSRIRVRYLESTIPHDILKIIYQIGKLASDNKINVFLVGGFVRDILLGIENFDIDIVVESEGPKFAKILSGYFDARYIIHDKFATGVIMIPNGIKIDISTARLEYYETPGALPTIELASIKQDLSRRDFTINAMAISLNENGFGELIDFFCGQQDLKNKKIRVLHNLSFVEDPTRIFRAIRFEQRFGFKIDRHTENLIKHAVKSEFFDYVAFERIREELIIMLNEQKPVRAIQRIYEFDELKFIDPAFSGRNIDYALFERIEDAITWYKLSFFKTEIKNWIIYFMGLIAKLPVTVIFRICSKLKIQKKDMHIVIGTMKNCYIVINALSRNITKNSFLYMLLRPYTTEGLLFLMALTNQQEAKEKISLYISNLRHIKIEFTGQDIINSGLKPSPYFKKILYILLMEKVNGKIMGLDQERERFYKLVDAYRNKKYNDRNSIKKSKKLNT